MTYQSLILAAGALASNEKSFYKCRTIVRTNESLLEVCLDVFATSERVIIAVNPGDYEFFADKKLAHNSRLVEISYPTQGALATSGMCIDQLEDDVPIIVSAVDGICFNVIDNFIITMKNSEADGGVIVFPSDNVNYSYVRVNQSIPIEFAEKSRIGALATAGIYYFKNREIFADAILWAILNQVRYGGVYYFSSAMNKLIAEGMKVELFEVKEIDYYRFSTESESERSILRLRGKIE